MGCHFLLQWVKVKSESEVAQSCRTLSDPMGCSPPGSSLHGIFQARVLEYPGCHCLLRQGAASSPLCRACAQLCKALLWGLVASGEPCLYIHTGDPMPPSSSLYRGWPQGFLTLGLQAWSSGEGGVLGFPVYVISSLCVSQTWVSLNNLRTSQLDPGLVKPPLSLIVRAMYWEKQ